MKLYQIHFRNVEKDYNPEKWYIKTRKGDKTFIDKDKGFLVMESDIKKWWEEGGGILRMEYVGDIDDKLFQPILAEPDFVDNQIRSKRGGDVLGYQV